ncbi:tRNA pseudouridine synthase B [Halobacillus andaensis]|uniref:tRNA pseudouridine synthase B n=1 Tax=Halobacillus andaensis TaxID=1176239 RepID=A0A917AZG5_HALAA|nr:tRNA pseudouridine(55) synthase TruB [Halobacillus andaensis]MBP2003451.1 tRNA pseudouridine55 synthase [Halobacillus andaensis]GGF10676.1 tRNA pseudouridine synthase B [Halobacillus andaensis]
MNGILPLWKEKGFTSHDCVSKARGMLKTKKIGHTGTLDPDVEGVLPLCIGKATKIVPFLTDTEKVYEAEVTVGRSTETEDASGAVIDRQSVTTTPSKQEIANVIQQFEGQITQIPPMYSAVKVKGKRLYEYARDGETVERPVRSVNIHKIQLHENSITSLGEAFTFKITVTCSKGTYIRTLCVDIGKALGYPAHMSSLVRSRTGDIDKAQCYTFAQFQQFVDAGNVEQMILPMGRGLNHLNELQINEDQRFAFEHGQVLEKPSDDVNDPFVVKYKDEVLAIYQQHPTKPDKIKPIRVF